MDEFNAKVRRIANLLAYEQPVDREPRMLVVAAELYNSYVPFDMPIVVLPNSRTVSGEFMSR